MIDRRVPIARLITLPTEGTLKRIKDILAQPPLKLDPLETLHVTVARAYSNDMVAEFVEAEKQIGSDQVFAFKFDNLDYVYDDVLNTSKILAAITCPGLAHYHAQLSRQSKPLTVQFLHSAPPLSRSIKSFVVSVADTLVMKEELPFTLRGMYLMAEADYQQKFKSHYVGISDNTVIREHL